MSDHAQDVNEPVEPVEESSTSAQLEQGAEQGAATPSDSPPEQEARESGAQKRIRELTWKQREAERRAEAAEQRLRDIESQKPAEESPSDIKIPVESEYDDPEQYRKDLDTYTRSIHRQEEDRRERTRTAQQSELERQQRLSAYQDKCAAYAADHPEFVEDVTAASKAGVLGDSPHVLEYMTESEVPAEMTHYLAKNPDHAARIEAMSPTAAARELAKVELSISQAQPKKLSDAPPPMTDIDDGGTTDPSAFTGKESVDEWMEKRRAQLRNR